MADEISTAEFEPNADDETWHEIENLVDEISAFSRSAPNPETFYQHLLARAVSAMAAPAAGVWLAADPASNEHRLSWRLAHEIQLSHSGVSTNELSQTTQARVANVAAADEICVLPPASVSAEANENHSPLLLMACPVRLNDMTVAVVEVYQRTEISPAAQRGYVRLLTILSELAADFHRSYELSQVQAHNKRQLALHDYATGVHNDLDYLTTVYRAANEGRRVLNVDRCSIASIRRRRARLEAVSGLDQIDRRANVVRDLERLVEAVVRTGEPLWYTGHRESLPPQLDSILQRYLDESHVRVLAIVPLVHKTDNQRQGQTHSALVIEHFDRDVQLAELRADAAAVAKLASPAIRHAMTVRDLPFRSLLFLLAPFRMRQLPKTITALLLLAAFAIAAVVVPADFLVVGRGELQPIERHDLFAPSNAQVDKLFVEHAQEVEQGDVLAQLQYSKLEIDFNRVVGEIDTNQEKLDTVNTNRIVIRGDNTAEAREKLNQLDAERRRLQVLLKSLNKELELLQKQRQKLTLKSPIKGQVLTWNVDQRLDRRPVQRGQRLMTVVNTKGPWELIVQVPDHHVGHVLAAQRAQQKQNLSVSFVLGLRPGQVHSGSIESVAFAAEVDETNGASVKMRVRIDAKQISHLRPGASAVVKIHCGRRSLGYVWLHDLIDAIRTRWF